MLQIEKHVSLILDLKYVTKLISKYALVECLLLKMATLWLIQSNRVNSVHITNVRRFQNVFKQLTFITVFFSSKVLFFQINVKK